MIEGSREVHSHGERAPGPEALADRVVAERLEAHQRDALPAHAVGSADFDRVGWP